MSEKNKDCIWKKLEVGFVTFTDCCLLFKPNQDKTDK